MSFASWGKALWAWRKGKRRRVKARKKCDVRGHVPGRPSSHCALCGSYILEREMPKVYIRAAEEGRSPHPWWGDELDEKLAASALILDRDVEDDEP